MNLQAAYSRMMGEIASISHFNIGRPGSNPAEKKLNSSHLSLLVAATCLAVNAPGLASPITCPHEGVQPQRVHLSYGGEFIDFWEVTGEEPYEVALPTGFRLGVAVFPAPREVHLKPDDLAGEFMLEAVTIELFDMSSSPPKRLSRTYGGSNSLQGFGPHGGATTVEEVGPKDLELFLQRPVCVRVTDVPSQEVAGVE